MKRTISMLLALVMILGMLPFSVLAAQTPGVTLSVDKTTVKAGEEITVTVALDTAIDNVMLAEFYVQYDTSLFTRGEATVGTALTGTQVSAKNVALDGRELKNDGTDAPVQKFSINSFAYPGGAPANVGTIATIKFTAREDISTVADTSFQLECLTLEDKDFAAISLDVKGDAAVTVQPVRYVKWYSGTTSMNGTIDLNIYVVLSDDLVNADDTFVRFTYAGKTVDVPMADAVRAPRGGYDNCYRFTCPIYAKQLADQVRVRFMKGEEVIGKELNYSVETYCKNRIKKSTDTAEVAMCKALLNYGAAAQVLLNYNTDKLANASLSDADKVLPDVDASAHKYVISGSETGIKAKSATLMFEDVVKVRVYFTLTGDKTIDDYTFTIDGKVVTPSQNAKGWYVETDGIAAKDLEKMFQVQVGGITVNYGALSYVNSKVTSSKSSENEKNLAKALYIYWQAAESYLG